MASDLNEELVGVDKYPYRPEWEITTEDAATHLASDRGLLVDVRSREDVEVAAVEGSVESVVLDIGHRGDLNPFLDAPTLAKQWKKLDDLLQASKLADIHPNLSEKSDAQVVCICYDGHTAKIATSILRARGISAYYIVGGYETWVAESRAVNATRDSSV